MTTTDETTTKRTPIELLRLYVRNLNCCGEAFLDRFTLPELLTLAEMQLASDADFDPHSWTERQIADALAGKAPRWDDDDRPVYDPIPLAVDETSPAFKLGLAHGLAWDLDGMEPEDLSPDGWAETSIQAMGSAAFARGCGFDPSVVPMDDPIWERAWFNYDAGAFRGVKAPQSVRTGRAMSPLRMGRAARG